MGDRLPDAQLWALGFGVHEYPAWLFYVTLQWLPGWLRLVVVLAVVLTATVFVLGGLLLAAITSNQD
jgi:hypothetical protein